MYMYAKWRRLNIQLSMSCNIVLIVGRQCGAKLLCCSYIATEQIVIVTLVSLFKI